MSATNNTGRANHPLLMTFCSPHAVIGFDVPPTASHKNNSAELVRASALCSADHMGSIAGSRLRCRLVGTNPGQTSSNGVCGPLVRTLLLASICVGSML